MISRLKAVDAAGFANMNAAAAQSAKVFRDAAASTGQFEVQQLRLNSATDDYVKKLKAQKASFREIMKSRKVAAAAYKEQLAMENMTLRRNVDSTRSNKGMYDVIIPKEVSSELDTAAKRLAFMNAELKSGAHQMVNWGKNTQWAGRQLMVGFTMPIAAFGAAAGVMAYQVDKELTRIQKVYDTTANSQMGIEKELQQVRVDSLKTATAAANEYGMAATDTLEVQAELAATGKTGVELQKSTLEVMRIARLGEIDNQTAIDATVALQSIWRMSNEDLTESFNYMNSVENATSLSTADFAAAIPVAASSVKAFGGDVKELGVLLTAMKENGIGASEGANALKATMQRLGRPSKQIREEWAALTGTDITQLVDQSDGLVEVFTKINEATENLDEDSRRKAFAGLFGSYQVSKMMALTKGMGELRDGVGQVSDAYAISNQSAEQWAQTAEKEVERYQKSLSGMWDIAFNSMKVELAELGEPFLQLATYVVKGVGAILKAFNDMPDLAKYFIAGGIAITAMAGGVLMLVGLFANLTGNMLKGIGSLVQFATKIDLIDKNSKAAELATDSATSAYLQQADAIQMLTMQMGKLAAAQAEANDVMLATSPAFAGMPPGLSAQQQMTMAKEQARIEKEMLAWRREDSSGREYFVAPAGSNYQDKNGNRRSRISRQEAEAEGINEIYRQNVAVQQKQVDIEKEGLDLLDQRDAKEEQKNKRMTAGLALMAAESVALGLMLGTSNELANNIGNVVMLASLVAPALSVAAPLAAAAGSKMKLIGKAAMEATKGATLFSGGLRGAGAALGAMMGPVGWIATALGAGAVIAYKLWKNTNEQQEKMVQAQKTLAKAADNYGESLGYARREMETISSLALAGNNEKTVDKYQDAVDYYSESETGKAEVKAFEGLDSSAQEAAAMTMLIRLQQQFQMSAEEAAISVAAMWSEANDTSSYEALTLMRNYNEELGNVRAADMSAVWENMKASQDALLDPEQFDGFWTSKGDARDKAVEQAIEGGKQAGQAFAVAFNASYTPEQAAENTKQLVEMASAQWDAEFARLSKDPEAANAFRELGITSGQEFAEAMDTKAIQERLKEVQFAGIEEDFYNAEKGARKYESAVISAAASSLSLSEGVDTIPEFLNEAQIATAQMTKEQKIAYVQAMEFKAGMSYVSAEAEDAAVASATLGINAALASEGLETGEDYAEALARWTAYINGEVYGAANGADALAGGLNRAKGQAQGLSGLLSQIGDKAARAEAIKDVVTGMQDELADGWRDQLSENQEAEVDHVNKVWDDRADAQQDRFDAENEALSNRQEAESRAFDAAWDAKRKGLENYWDARIEGIDKAIEAEEKAEEKRQKMFDNEIARINRLADMANTNIDFNVALNQGNLDEAAKIANSAAAKDAEFVMNRERDRGAEKSAARVDRLGDKQEGLEDQKDAAMEGFDKREEAARAHFDKMQEMESESLKKRQEMEKASLDRRAEMEKKALDERHERESKNLERILKTFLASTPTTKKALQKQIEELGGALDKFGIDTLDPMSKKWGNWFKNRMRDGLTNSALEAATADAWAKFGEATKKEMLTAWGFKTEQEFFDFINGKPQVGMKGAGKSPVDATPQEAADAASSQKSGPQNSRRTIRHKGGPVVGGNDSRYGVAKNYKGLHPSEIEVTARKGEYIMSENAVKNIGVGRLNAMNAGRGVGIGGATGAAGRLGAVAVGSIAKGLMKIGKQKVADMRAAQAAASAAVNGPGGSGGFSASGYVPGQGGWQRPSTPGFGWRNTHDYGAPAGTPIYAISDGYIADSRAITSGGSPGNGSVTPSGVPYRSYGETIGMRAADGSLFRYAHLSARYVGAGQKVSGGDLIGRTGNTGNSTGDHLHMDVNGNYNASGYLASRGIALRKGAEYVKFDNTLANLHRGESVLTKNLTDKMHQGVDNFANGPQSSYNVNVTIDGYDKDKKALAREVIREIKKEAARAPQKRSVGGN